MDCDETISRAADLGGDDPAVAAHVERCDACRAAIEEARDAAVTLAAFERDEAARGDGLPPADADAAWRAARRRVSPHRVLRFAARAAAVLLAATGALALAGARVETSQGRVAFVLAPAWAAPASPASPAAPVDPAPQSDRAVAAVAAVHADVAARIEDLERKLDERLDAQASAVGGALDAVAGSNGDDVRVLVHAVLSLRREVAALRAFQVSLDERTALAPPLPDLR